MSEFLKQVSDALAATVEAASPSTVRVEGRRRLAGTGVVWSAGDSSSLIITAHHVLERAESLEIGLHDGSVVEADLVGRAPGSDLAVLRTSATLTPAQWAQTDDLQVGHLVLALGRPGDDIQATFGVVSAISGNIDEKPKMKRGERGERGSEHMGGPFGGRGGREWRERGRRGGHRHGGWWGFRMAPHIRTDVVMYPGFSGGPLVDASGQVRGVNTSGFRGASITIPTATVRTVVETLLSHGRMRQGFLGVGAQAARLPDAIAEELQQETGLLIVSIEADSPAQRGGLLVGDLIVSLDGEAVSDLDDLLDLLNTDRVGKEVPVGLVRGGVMTDARVTIGERE